MIKRVTTEIEANECDKMLNELIIDEKKYNKFIEEDFKVKFYYKNIMDKEENIILVDKENINDEEIIRGYVFARPIRDDEIEGYLINALYVKEEYRNMGIAKKLLNEVMNLVKEKNPKFIDINVMYDNNIAKKIYDELNFKPFRLTMRLDK